MISPSQHRVKHMQQIEPMVMKAMPLKIILICLGTGSGPFHNTAISSFRRANVLNKRRGVRRSTCRRKRPRKLWKSGFVFNAVTSDKKIAFELSAMVNKRAEWVKAINCKMNSLLCNKIWTLLPGWNSWNILTTKGVFKHEKALD